ncbi:MAG TPA: lytic murein transglycosylase B [Woeseiaceae bacterium]|nr:lytic murein transglycosylase B [Woeseiaceae bacterium]
MRILLTLFLVCLYSTCPGVDLDQPEVQSFIDEMVNKHDFDRDQLSAVLLGAEKKQAILDAISKPAEKSLNWADYRKIFITPERIQAGVDFWRDNATTLTKVADDSGVPPEMLVGIIGVETYFGRITGNYRVLDALSTLAFYYPKRSKFFRKELTEYLILAREEDMPAEEATGSYAGAMGRPQFMPSSFRAYAVDSTGDGKRDIWNNWTDVAGSIANYFTRHGWTHGGEVVADASLGSAWKCEPPTPASNSLTPQDTVASLSAKGVLFATDMPNDSDAQLLALEGEDGDEFWVGFDNFFVITRYNRSVMYAMAVHQLGQEIAREYRAHVG